MRPLKIVAALIGLTASLIFFAWPKDTPQKPQLTVFVSTVCSDCIKTRQEIMPAVEKEFRDKVVIKYLEIENSDNYKLLLSLQEKYHSRNYEGFPIFFMQGKFLGPEDDIKKNVASFIASGLADFKPGVKETPAPQVDLLKRFEALTPWAIVSVGLLDGFNPCAVTVIVFFMSFLATQGYRRREIVLIGLIFILSVYVTYVAIGLGTLEFIYRIQGFALIAKIVNISVGIFSIFTAGLAFYDYSRWRKSKQTGGLLFGLPKSVTERIHGVIRQEYKTADNRQKTLVKIAVGALATGFLVSAFEAVCVVKIYLPTIVFVLKTTGHKLKALAYLLLYNLLFVIPLLAVFFAALAGTTSQQFSDLLKKHLGLLKILMGLMFLGLGIFLIWRA